jgi:hypothetical protein
MSLKKSLKVFIVFVGIIVLSSCTKEKAEALQLAAEQFRIDAILAIDQINFIFLQDVSIAIMTEDQQTEEMIELLNLAGKNELNSALINEFANSLNPGLRAKATTNEAFEELKKQYYQFEKMFSSLDKGSYFAKDAVADAEKHAVNLTLQLINYAGILQGDFRFASSRAALITKMQNAKDEPNEALRQELYKNISIEFIQLLKEEIQTQERAIRQCYIAAESGNVITELIQDYDKMNVSDIMNTIKGTMNFALEVTNGNQTIADLATKFEGVEKTIRENPDYAGFLEKGVISGKQK